MDRNNIVKALRTIYNDFSAEQFFTDSSYISVGLKEMVSEADKTVNMLRFVIDSGVGNLYLPLIRSGVNPDPSFRRQVLEFLNENGITENMGNRTIELFDQIIGWEYESKSERAQDTIIDRAEPEMNEEFNNDPQDYHQEYENNSFDKDSNDDNGNYHHISSVEKESFATQIKQRKNYVPIIIIVSCVLLILGFFFVVRYNETTETSLKTEQKSFETYEFGHYNGQPIEWIILDQKDGKTLLLSKYVLDIMSYNNYYENVTWQSSTLRFWLNGDFYTASFDNSERSKIFLSTIINNDNSVYGTSGGNNTEDYIFLLSIDEANEYFDSDDARRTQDLNGSYEFWWLRSPGHYSNLAANVSSFGNVYEGGNSVVNPYFGVRPAMWVDLES